MAVGSTAFGWRPGADIVAVLVAEIVQHFYPRLVDLHNFSVTNSTARKAYNWATINSTVECYVITWSLKRHREIATANGILGQL